MHRKRHYRAEDTNIQRAAIDQQLFSSVHSCLRLWKDRTVRGVPIARWCSAGRQNTTADELVWAKDQAHAETMQNSWKLC